MLPRWCQGASKVCAQICCPKQEAKKEVKAYVEAGMAKIEEVKHFVDKTGNQKAAKGDLQKGQENINYMNIS